MKRYLITGASRGIGRAIAEKLADPDVELLLHGRDTVALAEVCKAVKHNCGHVVRLIHDLAVPSGVSDLIDHVGKKSLDLLVNNAGIAIVKPFCEITPVEWEQTVGVNITAPFMLNAAFCPRDAARIQHRQHSFHRGENRLCQLERLLHEQVRAGRIVAMRARRIAPAQNSRDQRLSYCYGHQHLESD
ncbi:MAG TPA: SDR family NAD(P)-dependent oxidoreductase [Candidatus Udaeobacter sp.]|nr:SDR family NAD(P)-dependent oxidoreductase [Candidatus Udaeobacter sp.]